MARSRGLRLLEWLLRRWVFSILAAVTAVLALVFGGLAANAASGDLNVPGWHLTALILGIGTIVLGLLQKILEAPVARALNVVEAEAREDTLTLVNGSLLPLADRLVRIASLPQPKRRSQIEAMREACVASALGVVGASKKRATYFLVSRNAGGQRQMTPHTTRGSQRTDSATTVFNEGEALNSEVWDLADHADAIYFPDLDDDRPESWPADYVPVYKTFISVGVGVLDQPPIAFGLLTINAIAPSSFSLEDVASLRVIAKILATAEALCAGTQQLNAARNR
jgi:hypothetical protein